jgi:hypothetical protein
LPDVKVLVVSNASAARARRGVPALREALPESARTSNRITTRPDELITLVGHDRWEPDDLLVINGGDGSVQHALTALLGHCPATRLPRIACLPGGTTNMTAFDLNHHRRFGHCVETLRRATAPGETVAAAPRRVVRVGSPGAAASDTRYGLFFGMGTIVQGIEYFHQRIRHHAGGFELGAGAALVRTLWGIARQQPPFSLPLEVHIEACGLPSESAGGLCPGTVSLRLLLATTLDRLFLGMRPYWGTGAGALKATLVERRAPAFVTKVPRLLRGRPDHIMTAARGYHSGRVDGLALGFRGSYTLDGELFGNSSDKINVSATEALRFLPL